MQTISILQAIFGLAMLTFGRRLYWLFVGGVGFALGFTLAARFLESSPLWTMLLIGLAVGVLAALAAVIMNRLVLGIAGFLVGGYLAAQVIEMINLTMDLPVWLVFVIGGALCALLVAILFDWALVAITSLVGAASLVQLLNASSQLSLVLIAVLVVIGFFIQGRALVRK